MSKSRSKAALGAYREKRRGYQAEADVRATYAAVENEFVKRAVETLVWTDDWTVTACGDRWAVLIYSHASPDDARTVRIEEVPR